MACGSMRWMVGPSCHCPAELGVIVFLGHLALRCHTRRGREMLWESCGILVGGMQSSNCAVGSTDAGSAVIYYPWKPVRLFSCCLFWLLYDATLWVPLGHSQAITCLCIFGILASCLLFYLTWLVQKLTSLLSAWVHLSTLKICRAVGQLA